MIALRKSFEAGHRRKFLVVVDATPECDRALFYAAKRAERSGGGLVLLYVVVPEEVPQWLGVAGAMRADAHAEAEATMSRVVDRARAIARVEPEVVIREGKRTQAIGDLIAEDADIAILVLAAGTGKDGPGPLVSSIATGAAFAVPVTIVPGSLSDADIAALA